MTADQLGFDLERVTAAHKDLPHKRAVLLDAIRDYVRTHPDPFTLWDVLSWSGLTDLFDRYSGGSQMTALANDRFIVYVDSPRSSRPGTKGSRLNRWRWTGGGM